MVGHCMQGMDPGCCSWDVRLGGGMEDAAACLSPLPIGQPVTGHGEKITASIAS